jgi:hypothetical protein
MKPMMRKAIATTAIIGSSATIAFRLGRSSDKSVLTTGAVRSAARRG